MHEVTISNSGVTPSTLVQDYRVQAPTYDATRFSSQAGRFLYETDRRIVRELIGRAAPRTVLDVPTGTGRVLDYLADQPLRITGVDCTSEMLSQASRHVRPGKDATLMGNAAHLPFADGSFDCLVSLRFFHLFDRSNRWPFADEFRRLVRPGGHLLLSMTNGWYAGGLNWLKQWRGRPIVKFEYRGEVRQLFPGWRVLAIRGNFLPFQWAVSRLPIAGKLGRFMTSRFPMNHLCWERFYLLQKP